MNRPRLAIWSLAAFASAQAGGAEALEWRDGAVKLDVEYTADYLAGLSAPSGGGRFLDNLDLSLTLDLGPLAGWRDATLFVHGLNNSGGAPNDFVGTLQGVDNIEVERRRARLYELWIEKSFGPVSLRGGLYDLNSEFYSNESAQMLLAPAFGVGSELAATGPNGPSIFPSTALALRVAAALSERDTLRFAALNADAGVLGDPGGVDTEFDNGALLIGEWERSGDTRFSLGGWVYTDRQDDIREVDGAGNPLQRRAFGVYATLEAPVWSGGEGVRETKGFVRVGASEGETTPYEGGWQAGLLISRVFASRPDSAVSIGLNEGLLNRGFRRNRADAGAPAERAESAIELTYADRVGWLMVQPDLQFVMNPDADASRDTSIVGGLRVSVSL